MIARPKPTSRKRRDRWALVLILATLLGLGAPGWAKAAWREARTPNFIVYSDGSEDQARAFAAGLEDYDALLRTLTGVGETDFAAPLKVYVVGAGKALPGFEAGEQGRAGFYVARVGATLAFAARGDRPGLSGQEILQHEYAHHFMKRHHPAYHPVWYVEGFAEYLMTASFEAGRAQVGRPNLGRSATLLGGTWLPLETVLTRSPDSLNPVQRSQFYAESWLLVHYLLSSPERSNGLSTYLDALAQGVAERDAFQRAFSVDHADMEARLKQYMRGMLAYGWVGLPASFAPDTVRLRTLLPSADALLLAHAALMIGVADPDRKTKLIADIRKAAATFGDDPYARKVLARAEIDSGDRAFGAKLAEQLMAADSGDPELPYIRGLADFYSGRSDPDQAGVRFAAARPWFEKAVALDPTFYTAHYRLAQCLDPGEAANADLRFQELGAAHALAPQVSDIALDMAEALILRRRWPEARAILLSVTVNPHATKAKRAWALLEKLP